MADKKISQLSNASTPLAGTETLPIVQSNTTVKVITDDLTVKNVRSNATTGILQIAGPTTAATRTMTVPDANFTVARIDAANSFTGNQTLSTGNLVIGTAGKGVDFSANSNAAGMTSELLDWYEIGTFTPVWGGSGGDPTCSYTSQTGRYTRIGDMVFCWVEIVTSATSGGSGNLQIKGLPFLARDAEMNTGFCSGFTGNFPNGAFAIGTAQVTLTATVAGVQQEYIGVSTLSASSYIACRVNYRVA